MRREVTYKEIQYGFIGDVFVEPSFRKQVYAQKQTYDVLEYFSKKDINTVRFIASDNAKKLYKSLGFKETDQMIIHK